MMRRCSYLFALFLVACASDQEKAEFERPETLASLQGRELEKLEDLPVSYSLEKAISGYRELLPEVANSQIAPEVMRRLADLQIEFTEISQAELGENGKSVEEVDRLSQLNYQEAIALYTKILREHPQDPSSQYVWYQLGRVYEQQGDSERLLKTLTQYAQKYPDSEPYAEVQFRRGELLFSKKEFRSAQQAYAAVLKVGEASPFYEQSLYKHGWTQFKRNQYEQGLDSFLTLLDRRLGSGEDAVQRLEQMSGGEREQLEDTLRVIALTFSYQDGAESLETYFKQKKQRGYEDVVYQRLAEHYLEQERYNDAAVTFEAYSQRNKLNARAPLFLVRVIESYEKGGFPNKVLAAKKAFAQRYDLESEYWQYHRPEDVPEVVGYLKTNVDSLAKHYHATAQASKKSQDYKEAVAWYRAYLRDFAADEKAPQMNFLLAEALYESKQYADAATEYEQAAYSYQQHPKSAEAGYAALLAYGEQEKRASAKDKLSWQRKGIDSSLKFANTFPQHPQAPVVLTHSAERLYALGEAKQAEQTARQVLQWKQPLKPEQKRTAWVVLAHSSFDQQNYVEAEQAYTQVLNLSKPDDAQRKDLNERLAASVYKQGEAARDAGDQTAAAGHFLRVAKVAPSASIRATAEYDAAAALINAQDWQTSATVLEDFRKRYPKHPQQFEVTQKLALVYLESKQPLKAAGELERIETQSKDPEQRRQAVLQAADLYATAKQPKKAIAAHQRYVKTFPKPAEAAIESRLKIAELSKELGDQRGYQQWMREIIVAHDKAGNQRTDRTRLLAARASMVLAEPWRKQYKGQKLVVPLKKSLANKKKSMEQVLKAYTRAADYGIEEITTEATYQIGDVYVDFSQALYGSERPQGLNDEELEQYDILLEEQAYPFEEKAIEIHEVNVGRVVDGVYDEWVKRSFRRLETLVPARYKKHERYETYVDEIR